MRRSGGSGAAGRERGAAGGVGTSAAGGSPLPAAASRVTAQVRALRFDTGSLALDLVATLGRRYGTPVERLDGPDRLREWCSGAGLPPLGEAEAAAGLLADLRSLREAVHDVAVSDLRGSPPSLASVALVNECAHHSPPPPRLELSAGAVAVEPAALSGRALRSLVARDLVALMGDARRRAALRECGAEPCRMLYLDTTAGRRRRWCSMRLCGNSAKAARHRSRAATDPDPAPTTARRG